VSPARDADLLALALDAARRAGDLLLAGSHRVHEVSTKSSPTDVVTEMDTASERLISDIVFGARPDDGLLGEEGADRAGTSGFRWVVDPLDGTVNYLYGLPWWAVSIAAEIDGIAQVGVVHAPAMAQTVVATRGGGAWLVGPDDVRISRLDGSRQTVLAQALIATGFGYDAQRRGEQAAIVAHLLPRVRDIRRFGVASLDLCSVALGRVDGFYERGLQPWDLAAGALIASEAGARVQVLDSGFGAPDTVVAAPMPLWDVLRSAIDREDLTRA
jgi:myo-inositol-1(or 4)-monophosphatase